MKMILLVVSLLITVFTLIYSFNLKSSLSIFTQVNDVPKKELRNQEQIKEEIKDNQTKEPIVSPKVAEIKNKEYPEWLIPYKNLPANKQLQTVKDILSKEDSSNSGTNIADIADNLELFPAIYQSNSYNNALGLIDEGYAEIVLKNMDKFGITDTARQEEIINKVRKKDQIYLVAQNYKFFNLSKEKEIKLAEELVDKHFNDLIESFQYFKQIPKSDHVVYVNKSIDKDKENTKKYNYWSGFSCLAVENLHKFTGLSEKQKIEFFYRTHDNKLDCGKYIVQNIDKLNITSVDARLEIASKIILEGYGGHLTDTIQKFNFNSQQQLLIAQRIIDDKNNIDSLERDINYFNAEIREEILKRIK
jgi:hypothetical protein